MHPTPNPMNTELLKRLQDLQEGITLISGPQGELRKAVDDCIKLAKLSYFEGRMKGGDQPKEPVAWMKRDSTSDLLPESALDVAMEPDAASYIRKTWMPLFAHPPKDQPKALTPLNDDEVHGIAWKMFPEISKEFNPHREVAIKAVQFARDNGYFASTDTDKLIEAWTDGDVEAAYLMGAMNASGHEPTGDTLWQSVDRVKAELDRIKDNGWKIADMVRQVRKAATSKDVGE